MQLCRLSLSVATCSYHPTIKDQDGKRSCLSALNDSLLHGGDHSHNHLRRTRTSLLAYRHHTLLRYIELLLLERQRKTISNRRCDSTGYGTQQLTMGISFSSPHVDFQTGCKRRRRKGSIGVAVHLSLCDDKIVIFHKETFIRQSSPQPVLVTIIFLSILWTVAKSGDKLNSSFISGSTSLCPQHTDATYSWPAASSAEGHPKNKSSLWCVCGELRNEWSNGQIFCGPLRSTVFWSKVSLTNAATAPWLCNFTLLPLAVVARQ